MSSSTSSGNRVALYARVSTTDQHPEAQVHALEEYVHARGFEVVKAYIDHGVSGRKDGRPALDDLVRDARRRRFDAVVCVRLDRLARSLKHLTELASEWEDLGVELIVLEQSIDTTTSAGRLLFGVLGAIAQFDADLVRERTVAGLAAEGRHSPARFALPSVISALPLQPAAAVIVLGVDLGAGTQSGFGVELVSRATTRAVLGE